MIALSANDDKRMQSIDSIEAYAYITNEEIIHRKQFNKAIQKMINYDDVTKEIHKHNLDWTRIPDQSFTQNIN